MNSKLYYAPKAEVIEFHSNSIVLASGLEDYEDNPIFSSPKPDSLDDFTIL